MTREEFLEIASHLGDLITGSKYENHVYAVGGSVRDYVMEEPIKDIDVVVDLDNGGIGLAEYLKEQNEVKGKIVVYPTYGTAMFRLLKYPNVEIEAVYTRGEKYANGSRNPETKFASIQDDCVRRDLTINALYYNVTTGEILDLTGMGLNDIENRCIRVPNVNPDIVFKDDPLRILRVVRFATRYGWKIDFYTYKSMKNNVGGLGFVSQERITSEFNQMLSCENSAEAVGYLFDIGCLDTVFANQVKNHTPNIAAISAISKMAKTKYKAELSLALLLYEMTYGETVNVLRNMKYSNDTIKTIMLAKRHISILAPSLDWKRIGFNVSKIQHECGNADLFYATVDCASTYSWTSNNAKTYDKWYRDSFVRYWNWFFEISEFANMYNYKVPVTGNDIMLELNIPPSKKVGELLEKALLLCYANNNITYNELINLLKNEK